jgi:hypothetical protein
MITIDHPMATKENVKEILDALLIEFIEIAGGFPEISADKELFQTAAIYIKEKS